MDIYDDEFSAKILIIGDSNVGKSSLFTRYTEKIFRDHNPKTIG